MENEKRKKKRGNAEALRPYQFTSTRQPDPKLKSQGWQRRREKKKIMDTLQKYSWMSLEELDAMETAKGTSITLREKMLLNYAKWMIKDKTIMMDWINRNVPYAPKEIEMSWKDGWPIKYNNELTPEQQQALEALQSTDDE